MNQHYLQLYADFIVKVGVNVQPRQNFIIRCPVTMPEFGHACVKAGYEAGAKNCIVRCGVFSYGDMVRTLAAVDEGQLPLLNLLRALDDLTTAAQRYSVAG